MITKMFNNRQQQRRQQRRQRAREAWVMDALYGQLDDRQRAEFEQVCTEDRPLQLLWQQHCELNQAIPRGVRAETDPLQRQHWRQNVWQRLSGTQLRQQRSGIWRRIGGLSAAWRLPSPVQALSLLGMFVIGFAVNGWQQARQGLPRHGDLPVAALSAALHQSDGDRYRLVDLHMHHYDASGGDLLFSLAVASQSQVRGNIHNHQVRQLLVQALRVVRADEVRLALAQMLSAYAHIQEVKTGLIEALLHDPNPGVRYQAVEALVRLSTEAEVRAALQQALIEDVNQGIRVEAFLALTVTIDAALVEVLRRHGVHDANTLIRERSKRILVNFPVATPLSASPTI